MSDPRLNLEAAKLKYGGFDKNVYGFMPTTWTSEMVFNGETIKASDAQHIYFGGIRHSGLVVRNATELPAHEELPVVEDEIDLVNYYQVIPFTGTPVTKITTEPNGELLTLLIASPGYSGVTPIYGRWCHSNQNGVESTIKSYTSGAIQGITDHCGLFLQRYLWKSISSQWEAGKWTEVPPGEVVLAYDIVERLIPV
jgi:hypothetical protein